MATARFSRRVESFVCIACGRPVEGDGFTDHCPACLVSLHVDVNPGDRLAACGGVMLPTTVEFGVKEHRLRYSCQACGYSRSVRAAKDDSLDALLGVAREAARRKLQG